MCGLVGVYATHPSANLERAFKAMLIADQVRGKDSTGMFILRENRSRLLSKDVGTPENFLYESNKDSFFGDSILMMGHNRAATKGKVSVENSHPFQVKNFVLAHNGTLHSRDGLPTHLHEEVDSHHIARAIESKSPLEVIPELNGAYALTFFDIETGNFSLVRNKERPLLMYPIKGGFLYASLDWLLMIGVETLGIQWNPENCVELPIHTLVTYNVYDKSLKPTVRAYEAKSFPTTTVYSGYVSRGNAWSVSGYDRQGVRTIVAKVSLQLLPSRKLYGSDLFDVTSNEALNIDKHISSYDRNENINNKGMTGYGKFKTYSGGYDSKSVGDIFCDIVDYEPISEEEYLSCRKKKDNVIQLPAPKKKKDTVDWHQMHKEFKKYFRRPVFCTIDSRNRDHIIKKASSEYCVCCGELIEVEVNVPYLVYNKGDMSDNLIFCSFECMKELEK